MSFRIPNGLFLILAVMAAYLTSSCHFIFVVSWLLLSSPLASYVYQAGDDFLYSLFMRYIAFFTEVLPGTKLVLHGDVGEILKKKERVLCISNHQSAADWIVVNMLAERQGSLPRVRFLLKNSVQWLPIYGYLIYLHRCIYVNRKSFNANKMLSSLSYLRNDKIPSWISIFPEGTRYSPDATKALEKSQKYATDQGLAPFDHVYFPRHRGFQMVYSALKENIDSVYDLTLVYPDSRGKSAEKRRPAPTFTDLVTSCCSEIHVHTKRIPVKEIPESEEDQKRWMYNRFQEKELLLKSYYESSLPLPEDHPLARGVESPPKRLHDCIAAFLYLFVSLPFYLSWNSFAVYLRILLCCTVLSFVWKGQEYITRFSQKQFSKQE